MSQILDKTIRQPIGEVDAGDKARSSKMPLPEAIATITPSIPKTLRYVEWAFLFVVILRMLLLFLNKPLGYEPDTGDYIGFSVLGLLTLLSFVFPLHRRMGQRQGYVLLEIVLLLISRWFTDWGLDPFLYLVLVKSCFLLRRRDVIFTTIAAGLAWQISLAQRLYHQFSMPIENIREQFEASLEAPTPLLVLDMIINSTTIYIIMSLLIILLCWTVLAERKSRQQATALSQEVEVLAADLERTRIARDIHDSLGHTLTTLDVQLEVAQTLHTQEPERALQALNRAKSLSRQSLQEVRRAVSTMRHGHFDLSTALTSLVEQIQQTQTPQSLTIATQINLPNLPLQASQQLFLIIKEGLTNIQKHSQASVVKLWAQTTSEGIAVGLSDNGIGFSPEETTPGFGLRGMRERVQLLKGQMTIHSATGKGTLIQVTIPK
ncbi:MAG: sensor histidine kinase [Cyanobacteria bacterium J06635_1]